jgi:hypothetical protein
MQNEIGMCERFRFITSPDLPSIQDAGATVASTAGASISRPRAPTSTSIPSSSLPRMPGRQIAVRGMGALDPTYLPPGEKSKSDPLGQRGYAGTSAGGKLSWWRTPAGWLLASSASASCPNRAMP